VNQPAKQTTNPQSAVVQPKQKVAEEYPRDKLERQLNTRRQEFVDILPKNMKFEFFKGIIFLSCQKNPDLLNADRQSLITACLDAAHDGLLPDGREGAMLVYNTKVKRGDQELWIKKVQWVPMVGGIRKKARASKEFNDWKSVVVHIKDPHFFYQEGLEPKLEHKPYMGADDPGEVVAAYSLAILKNGEKPFLVMNRFQIEKVRAKSKAKDKGPWVTDYDEMCRKTVVKRHAKELPVSDELQMILQRDDVLYDVDGESTEIPDRPKIGDFTKKQLDAPKHDDVDMTPTAEITQESDKAETKGQSSGEDSTGNGKAEEKTADKGTAAENSSAKPSEKVDQETGEVTEYEPADAMQRGREDHAAGKARKALPPEFRTPDKQALAEAWESGWDDANEMNKPDPKKGSLV